MTPLLRKFLGMHWILFVSMVLLIAAGVYTIYAAVHFRDSSLSEKWNQQITFAVLGLIPFFAASLIDYKWLKWGALPAYIAGLGLLAYQGLKGDTVYSQVIAVRIGGVSIQAAQAATAGTIFLLAFVLGEGHRHIPLLKHYLVRFIVAGIIFGIPFIMVLKQKDLGSAMALVPVTAVMLLVGSIPFRCLIAVTLAGLIVLPWVYFFGLKEYQRERIQVTMDMLAGKEVNVKDEGYALNNILIAVGSSGWEGKGTDLRNLPLNQKSMLQLGYIPQMTSHNDFAFCVACETFGFRGAALLLSGFVFLIIMCLVVSFFSRDPVGRLLVVGVVGLLFAHVFEHAGMNIGLLPITGIPMPFISSGGTFLVICMFLMGMVQSVWVHRNSMVEQAAEAARHRPAPRPVPARIHD